MQVDQRSERRVLRADGSGPLPQFDLQSWESGDPDRTLERLPRLAIESSPTLPDVRPPPDRPVPVAPDFDHDGQDLTATVEFVPEVALDDIFEESEPLLAGAGPDPFPMAAAPAPIALPPRAVPFDLDRLLALARAEASKSPEYFRTAPSPSAPLLLEEVLAEHDPGFATPSALAPMAEPLDVPSLRTEPTLMRSAIVDRGRRRAAWIAGTVVAVAAVTLGIVVGQSGVSSARAPQSVSVMQAVKAPVSASTVTPAAPAVTELDEPAAIPAVAVQNLPVAEVGTISVAAVAASHRLFVDGKLADSGSVVVTCGSHLVQVGSRGLRHTVNVPCGQDVVLYH